MASYFCLRTNLSRGVTDATAKKKTCTWRLEYFRLDGELLESVSVFEDGLVYASPPARLTVPVAAGPSTAGAYAEAQRRCNAYQAQVRAQRRAAQASKLLRIGVVIPPAAASAAEPAPLATLPTAA